MKSAMGKYIQIYFIDFEISNISNPVHQSWFMGYSPAAQNASIKFPMGVTTDGSGLIWIKDTIIHILNRICIHISFILILVETTLKITEQLFSVFGLVFWRFGGIFSFCCCCWYEIGFKSMTTKNIELS